MRAALFAPLALIGCKIDLDLREVPRGCKETQSIPICLEAETKSDYAWIQQNIFSSNCSGDDCHGQGNNGQPPTGRLQLTADVSYQTLMGADGSGVMSEVDPTRQLVVPGSPESSYLYFLVRGVPAELGTPPFDEPPEDIGYMPMKNNPLCCQKVDAIARWIRAGALPQ